QAVPVASNAPIDRGTWTGLGVESPACGRHGASLPVASLLRNPFSGPEMPQGTLLYAQSGGVTAVINATASAVLSGGRARNVPVRAARDGILGALRDELLYTSAQTAAALRALAHTPGGGFGSCRYKLKSLEANRAKYERLLEVFAALDGRWFLYNGG